LHFTCHTVRSRIAQLLTSDARTEFEKNIRIDKRDFGAIEFLLRKGRRQLDMYSSPGVKDIR
jgi:hypothetical protein